MKRVFTLLLLTIILLLPFSILKISQDSGFVKTNTILKKIKIGKIPLKIISSKEKNIGKLLINKIDLNEELFPIDSPNNTVNKHVTIMKESTSPDQDSSIMILAAHSGRGKIAYFKELDKLQQNDEIMLIYKNNTYLYKVKEIWEEKKTGYINFNRENKKQLILTTCSPKKDGYQLVINCIEKESK